MEILEKKTILDQIFKNIKEVKEVRKEQSISHDLLKKFKPKYTKFQKDNFKINWISYEYYLNELKEYYKKYYTLKNIKETDSTYKKLINSFENQVSFYQIFFEDQTNFKLIIQEPC